MVAAVVVDDTWALTLVGPEWSLLIRVLLLSVMLASAFLGRLLLSPAMVYLALAARRRSHPAYRRAAVRVAGGNRVPCVHGGWYRHETTRAAAIRSMRGWRRSGWRDFMDRYNRERPHQALNINIRPRCFAHSPRPYRGLGEFAYPFHDRIITVTQCGRICMAPYKIMLSTVFAGQKVGVKQVGDKIRLVSFMAYDLGFFDQETTRLETIANPFEAKVLPMCPE